MAEYIEKVVIPKTSNSASIGWISILFITGFTCNLHFYFLFEIVFTKSVPCSAAPAANLAASLSSLGDNLLRYIGQTLAPTTGGQLTSTQWGLNIVR